MVELYFHYPTTIQPTETGRAVLKKLIKAVVSLRRLFFYRVSNRNLVEIFIPKEQGDGDWLIIVFENGYALRIREQEFDPQEIRYLSSFVPAMIDSNGGWVVDEQFTSMLTGHTTRHGVF